MTQEGVLASSNLATGGIFSLPDEILLIILTHIPPSTVLALSCVSRRLYTVTLSPNLWQYYCQTNFSHWDKRHSFDAKNDDKSFNEWKALFATRHASSTLALRAFNSILDSETNRFDRIHDILSVGYDAKDVLLNAYETAEGEDRHLAQRYWSHSALGCLHRWLAVQQWMRLKHRKEVQDEAEISFSGLDMFVLGERREGDPQDMFARLDSYARSVREAHPDIDDATPREKAILISRHLLNNHWVGISDTRDYHSLDHMFLGISLFSSNRNSVPLVSAITYCYVCRRFGLYAQPISYPFHVHALIKPPPGQDLDGNGLPAGFTPDIKEASSLTHLFMDPFASSDPVPLAHLLRQLSFVAPHATSHQMQAFLAPAMPRELTIRAAHNILSSPSHYPHAPLFPIPAHTASYAALFSLCVLPSTSHPAQLRQHLAVLAQHFLEYFDLDVELFEHHILPLTAMLPDSRAYRSLIENLRVNDRTIRRPKRRKPIQDERVSEIGEGARSLRSGLESALGEGANDTTWQKNQIVKYRVGQVFRHRRRGYLAVIYGWDPWCKMQEQWIAMNGVDRLPNGRSQPFYNVLVEDESTRYVAEENVNVLERYELDYDVWKRFPIEIGKWFKRWDLDKGVFTSNIGEEYPDD